MMLDCDIRRWPDGRCFSRQGNTVIGNKYINLTTNFNGKLHFVYSNKKGVYGNNTIKVKTSKTNAIVKTSKYIANKKLTENKILIDDAKKYDDMSIYLRTLEDSLNEITILKKIQSVNVGPKLLMFDIFKLDLYTIRVILAFSDITYDGYLPLSKRNDLKNLSKSFKDILSKKDSRVNNEVIDYLKSFEYNENFANLFTDDFDLYLEQWYSKNKKFINAYFRAINKMHSLNLNYVHSPYTVFYNGTTIKFVDFRYSKELSDVPISNYAYERRVFSNIKNKKQINFLKEMDFENYNDGDMFGTLIPMLYHYRGKDHKTISKYPTKYKLFLAKKYSEVI